MTVNIMCYDHRMSPMTKTTIIAALTLAVLTSKASAQSDSSGNATAFVRADTLHELCVSKSLLRPCITL
jgi:hypothetical protein